MQNRNILRQFGDGTGFTWIGKVHYAHTCTCIVHYIKEVSGNEANVGEGTVGGEKSQGTPPSL